MAMVKLGSVAGEKKGEVPPFFNERATLRIKEAKFGLSNNSGNKQLMFDCELLNPREVTIGGITYKDIDKQGLKIYVSVEDENLHKLATIHSKLGLPEEVDTDNPDVSIYKGVVFEFLLQSTEKKVGKKDAQGNYLKGEFVMGGDGKPLSQGWQWNTYADNILGLGTAEVNPLA